MTTQHDLASIEAEKKALIDRAVKPTPAPCGIYFLVKQDEVVYVGQSVDFHNRVLAHKKLGVIDFDTYSWIECKKADLNNMEAEYILKFKPVLNKGFPCCDRFVSSNALRSKGLGKIKFKNYVAKSSHARYSFFDYIYYDLQELMADQAFLDLIDKEGVRSNFPILSA